METGQHLLTWCVLESQEAVEAAAERLGCQAARMSRALPQGGSLTCTVVGLQQVFISLNSLGDRIAGFPAPVAQHSQQTIMSSASCCLCGVLVGCAAQNNNRPVGRQDKA